MFQCLKNSDGNKRVNKLCVGGLHWLKVFIFRRVSLREREIYVILVVL